MRVMEVLAIIKKKKMKFKVGDIVKVKSLDWYDNNKTEDRLYKLEKCKPFRRRSGRE